MGRKCIKLEQKLEASSEVAAQLKEAQQREKEMEKEMSAIGSDTVSRVRAAVVKQLQAQMLYMSEWNGILKEKGRSISAYVPNVSPELLKALGGVTAHHVHKRTIY